ncbi:hypothetical protein [Pseudochelatococcus sp. G4_1912]|uniref:glycine-rich domain-containing protein n=1 Tax=Pseudochelatococcus sp. G4_1912 TaxID=3114288 RepID=UPI0039C6C77F
MTNDNALDLASRNDMPLRESLHGDELLPAIDGASLVAVPLAALVTAATPEPLPPPTWEDLADKPDAFLPDAHQHAIADVVGLDDALDAKAAASTVAAIAEDLSDLTGNVIELAEDVSDLEQVVADKAPLASPVLIGIPEAPTAEAGTSTTQLATTAFVATAIAAIPSDEIAWPDITDKPSDFPPSEHTHALEDVPGLAAALGDKASADDLASLTLAIGDKAPLASPAFTGSPTAPTASTGTNTTQIATTAFTHAALAARPQAGLHIMTVSGNFTVPSGVSSIDVQLWGAGGGGGGVGTVGQSAGGGGGGGYCRARLAVTPGQVIAATVGAGGYSNPGGGGANGGNTTFGALVANGGGGGGSNPVGSGGAGGSATGGGINISGGYGGSGSGNIVGGAHGGNGGGTAFGGAGGAVTTYTGGPGQSPGGGGAGGGGGNTNAGGSGAQGMIIIRY